MYTVKEIKSKFLDYFQKNGHTLIKNSSIIPENDDSLLFINAGMAPIKNVFTGNEEPISNRMCNMQTCIRTIDIDSIGDRHHLSSFCMLGSWSIGDYFKKDAIKFAFNLLVNELKIPKEKLYATVFEGDKERNIPADTESEKYWQEIGMDKGHILYCPFEDNFWRMGDGISPCGPCTEIFYDTGDKYAKSYEETGFFDDKKRYIEIWNAGVFMQYLQNEDGSLGKLPFCSVDTGSGIERLVMTLNGFESVYEIEIYAPIIEYIKANSHNPNEESLRIIADHLRTSIYIINSGVEPSNVKRGYVLRRLLRRLMRHMRRIELEEAQLKNLVEKMYDNLNNCGVNPEWILSKEEIVNKFVIEQEKFSKLLVSGLKTFNEFVSDKNNIENGKINSTLVFKLYDTYGFPFEMTRELAEEQKLIVDEKEFNELFAKHKEESKGDIGKVFKCGLAEVNEKTTRYHTATHLLQAGLKKFLGDEVSQKGSNITEERMRFDFNFGRKVLPEELKQIEDYVNMIISEAVPVTLEEMSYDDAKNSGALGLFVNKYGDKVKVYTIGKYSKEICGGPHVKNTSELGHFHIQKEESSSAGIRRIKAILD